MMRAQGALNQIGNIMNEKLRLLIVEDSAVSAKAVEQEVRASGFEVGSLIVSARAEFAAALESGGIDAIVSDFILGADFNGRDALEIYRSRGLDIPFICVSGAITGEQAAELVRAGAHDYLSKDHLAKLGDVLRRELALAEVRRQRRRAEDLAEHLAAIVESSDDAIFSKDLEGGILTWNNGAQRIYGFSADEMIGSNVRALAPADRQDEISSILDRLKRGGRIERLETVRKRKDGSQLNVSLTISPVHDGGGKVIGASTIARDITQRHKMEEERIRLIDELQQALSKVKVLSGLLPICSSCKRIRDEAGAWHPVEVYVHEHSQADFTHGICPECTKELYPSIAERIISGGKESR